jgi:hypothetical protein
LAHAFLVPAQLELAHDIDGLAWQLTYGLDGPAHLAHGVEGLDDGV